MRFDFIIDWLNGASGREGRVRKMPAKRAAMSRRSFLPRLDALEDRTVPTTITVANNHDSGAGSLRQAILNANAAPGPDTIVFANSVHNITLTSGELAISSDLEIKGPGAQKLAISGNHASRIFDVTGGTVKIAGLTITNGRAGANAVSMPSAGGGVYNQAGARLTLSSVVVANNQAVGDPSVVINATPAFVIAGGALGGGVLNFGTLTVNGCTFTDNQSLGADHVDSSAFSYGTGPAFPGNALGGGLSNFSTATVNDSRFIGNVSRAGSDGHGDFAAIGGGGAIVNDAALTVTGSTFSHNQAFGGNDSLSTSHNGHALGGAIMSGSLLALFGLGSATLNVSQSEFDHNQAIGGNNNHISLTVPQADGPNSGFGGAILVFQGNAAINRSEFEHNRAQGGKGGADQNGSLGVGGGVFFFNFVGGVTASVTRSEFEHNVAIGGAGGEDGNGGDGMGGGIAAGGLGAAFGAPGSVTIQRSTIDHNLAKGGSGGTCTVAGDGGDGLGGGIYGGADSAITVTNSKITHNRARGGEGHHGGSDGQAIGGSLDGLGLVTVDNATNIAHNSPSAIPLHTSGAGFAPTGVPLFTGGSPQPHDATGTMTLLGTYTGNEGMFELLSIDFATLSGTFRGSFVFVGPNGDRAYFNYGADPSNPGTFTLTPTPQGFVITFVAVFTPVPSLSTGRFATATGGSFTMIATSEPVVPDPNHPGFTTPFHYTWVGDGSIEF